jgi:hypothetical protein
MGYWDVDKSHVTETRLPDELRYHKFLKKKLCSVEVANIKTQHVRRVTILRIIN